jgi:hypothetical protein
MREGSRITPASRPRLRVLTRALAVTALALAGLAATAEATIGPSVPAGFTLVVSDSIATPGYYDATVRTAYVQSTASDWTQMHERCHAHQHLTILQETGREPVGARWQLDPWYATSQGIAYVRAIASSSFTWPAGWLSDNSPLEDFANACGLYYLNPGWLYELDPIRYHAIEAAVAGASPG